MAIEPAAISASPAVMTTRVESTAPERPAASAKGTVSPSDIPMTMSRIRADAVKCFSTWGVWGIGSSRSVDGRLLVLLRRRRRRRMVVRHAPDAVPTHEDVGRLHARRRVLPGKAERPDHLDAEDPGDFPDDHDPDVLADDRPRTRIGEDVFPGAAHLRPPVQAIPARMHARDAVFVQPHRVHPSEVAGAECPIEGEIRRRNRRFFGGSHFAILSAASLGRGKRERSTFPPDTIATTFAPAGARTLPATSAAV